MDHEQVGRIWDENADSWAKLSLAGYDVYRDHLNTPAFFEMLPDVRGLSGLDIGCGDGYNTRLLAAKGAKMTGIDISERFIAHAQAEEERDHLWIGYRRASAVELPFPMETFDFATAFMSLMDMPEMERAIGEAHRVLKSGGFLQFSISHPCSDTPHRKSLHDENGKVYAFELGDYFRNLEGEQEEWIFSAIPAEEREGMKKFNVPRFTRTLGQWLNTLLDTGFILERFSEPYPDDDTVRTHPNIQDAQAVPYFLIVRVRKASLA